MFTMSERMPSDLEQQAAACNSQSVYQRASTALQASWKLDSNNTIIPPAKSAKPRIPRTTPKRLRQTGSDKPIIIPSLLSNDMPVPQKTVLYLAYGSNLSAETFRGARGINPLSAINVLVPSLALTFDLPGIPYAEPCFANTRRRDPASPPVDSPYHKDRWQKGLVGVVYEVTLSDYAVIIATEGGGASYQDITVACHEIPEGLKSVDGMPLRDPFLAHTLFCPQQPVIPGAAGAATDNGGDEDGPRRPSRPNPSYAQASARYLKLITDGAAEHELPEDYRIYLGGLRPYTITTKKQIVGKALFLSIWAPILLSIFALGRLLAEPNGKIPAWLARLSNGVFLGAWLSYDNIFKELFGDGERTMKRKDAIKQFHKDVDEKRLLLHDDPC